MFKCLIDVFDCLLLYSFWADEGVYPLLPFGADPDTITISGFSNGGRNSVMMSYVYSEQIKGVGLICGDVENLDLGAR